MLKSIESDNIAKSASPLSQAIRAGNLLFVSGQLGRDPRTGEISQPFSAEVRQTMENLGKILQEAKLGFKHVAKVNIYVTDLSKVKELNEIYREYFTGTLPARCCVEVSKLAKDANVEIELVADIS